MIALTFYWKIHRETALFPPFPNLIGDKTASHDHFILKVEPSFVGTLAFWIPSSGIFYFQVSWECFTWQKKPLFRKGRRALAFPGHWLYVLMLTTAFQGRYHPPCFIGKEAGAQSSKVICPRSWNCPTAEFYLPQYPLNCSCDRAWANHTTGMISIPATAQWGSYIAILFYRWEHWGSERLNNLLSSPR